MATISSGRSRHRNIGLVSAAVLLTAAHFRSADPGSSAPELRARPTREAQPAAVAATARPSIPNPPPVPAIDAEVVDRALLTAASGSRDLVLERMLTTWVAGDAQAAARFAELQTDTFLREVALRTVAQRWAALDRESAARWAGSLAEPRERDLALEQVALEIAESHADVALELLARRGTDGAQDDTRVGVITSWASRDFAAAQSWTESQPPGPARDEITQRLVFLRAQTDALAATLLADQLLDDETARRDAFASIVGPWVSRDPDTARAWIASLDEGTRTRLQAELTN